MLDSAGSTLVEWGRQQQQHVLMTIIIIIAIKFIIVKVMLECNNKIYSNINYCRIDGNKINKLLYVINNYIVIINNNIIQ